MEIIKDKKPEEPAEILYRVLFEQSPDGVLIIDPKTLMALEFNEAAHGQLGYTRNEFARLRISDYEAKEKPDEIKAHIENVMRRGRDDFEMLHRTKDGNIRNVLVTVQTVEFSGRAVFHVIYHDITEYKQALEALTESEIRFRSVTQSAVDAIISADSTGKIISWNRGAETIFGFTEEEVLGKPLIILIPERYRDAHQKGLERVNSTGETRIIGKTVELAGLRKDGSEFPLELSLSTWKAGEKRYYTGIIRDVTERKRAEKMLKKYAAELEEANHLKDLFTDIMRHDLLNPLNVIKITNELQLEKCKDDKIRKSLLTIQRNADKLIEMIESASIYARLESAEKLERSRPNLIDIFRTVADNFKPQIEEKNMTLEFLARGEFYAMVNPITENVFSNLLSNAIKYSPVGKKIEVNIIDEGESYKIYVKDWGYGIKGEDKAKLFMRFQRVDKRGVKGTGLGLAIVKRIVELHNGSVWIEDNPEGGSVFYVKLPKF